MVHVTCQYCFVLSNLVFPLKACVFINVIVLSLINGDNGLDKHLRLTIDFIFLIYLNE